MSDTGWYFLLALLFIVLLGLKIAAFIFFLVFVYWLFVAGTKK